MTGETSKWGGVYCYGQPPSISGGTTFSENSATYGGGVYYSGGLDYSATFSSVTFSDNAATTDNGTAKGGAAYINSGAATFTSCTLTGNTATTQGPGVCYNYPSATVTMTDCDGQGAVRDT